MSAMSENSTEVNFSTSSNRDSVLSFCQNTVAEARLQRYQLEQHHKDIQTLEDRVQHLELHKATQLGQDKIVGFLVGAVVLSLLSLITTFFFRIPDPSSNTSNTVSYVSPLPDLSSAG
jgi:hypothetical protein